MSRFTHLSALGALLACALTLSIAAGQDVRLLVRDGTPVATILIGSAQAERARRAAEELNAFLERASGARLPIIPEDEAGTVPADHTLVVIGGGVLAASLGVLEPTLSEETFVVKTMGRHVVFVGSDTVGPEREGSFNSPATLWAVGHFLEHQMGVRWLWPGELGTVVPAASTIAVPDLDVRERPVLANRTLQVIVQRDSVRDASLIGRETAETVAGEAQAWLMWHRNGMRERIRGSHGFRHWWETYHEEHPEIFATLPEGMKQPSPVPDRVKLCVAQPLVEELILKEWREAGRPDVWNIGPNDGQGYCVCSQCRALDVPDTLGAAELNIYWNRDKVSLAGRYLDLWRRVLDRMREENPEVFLRTLAYANYRIATADMAPLGHADGLVISYVPEGWSARERESIAAWQQVIGARVLLRPNDWHVGHAAPYLPLHEAGDFLRSALARGIIGYAHDTVFGYWATQGPHYYLQARLLNRPDMTVDEVLDEYASGFGQAAPAIREYLDYWETYSYRVGWPNWMGRFEQPGGLYERILTEHGLNLIPFWGSWYILPFLYTDEVLGEGHAILDRAGRLAGEDATVSARIGFLRDGLEHLALSRDVVALANLETRPEVQDFAEMVAQKNEFERRLLRLRNLRVDLTRRHVVWADMIDWHEERRRVKMSDRYADAWAFSVVSADDWGQWRFRKDPDDVGRRDTWYAAAADAGAWLPIQVPAYWDKSIGAYQGVGWYRGTFRMPAEWDHPTVVLSFGAVDEQAWVYLNGQPVGEHTLASESTDIEGVGIGDLWNRPFTVDIPLEQIRLGADNSLVVRVHNAVGAGGIWRPVHIQPPTPPRGLVADPAVLGEGTAWLPGESYAHFRMARRGSGRVDVTVDAATQGVLMEAGADGAGWALYMHDGQLHFQCGKGSRFGEEGQSLIRVPIQPGRHVIDWSVDQSRSTAILRIDGEIAGISEQPIYRYLAGSDPGGIGGIHGGGMCRNPAGWYKGDAGDFTGTIHAATVWPDKTSF